jgi:hypothetical protein
MTFIRVRNTDIRKTNNTHREAYLLNKLRYFVRYDRSYNSECLPEHVPPLRALIASGNMIDVQNSQYELRRG